MKSFAFGKKSSTVSKKELEDQRKKDDEQAAAQAFEEYVATFQDNANAKASKVWVKAGTYDAGKRQEDTKEKGKLYKPTSRFQHEQKPSTAPIPESSRVNDDNRPDRLGKAKKVQEKKKSNLEIFKEELKIIQEEREERHRLKKMLGLQEVIKLPPKPGDDLRASLSLELDDVKMGSIDDGDPNTTNIYLGNLPTKISEQQLMEIFGKYGPLASVKVMWPRTDEEKARNRLSGFVAFMSRRDGERALKHLAGKEILNAEVKLGWGKAVPIPPFPVYIPPAMMDLTMPPPPSGLPFNAQPDKRDKHRVPPPGTPYPTDSKGKEEFERVLYNATVKVLIPTDRTLIALIHRMIEFVTREGPMFEAMIMNREINNPQYRFLFENQSPAHIYYRWKLYSILQGDSTQRWRTEDFRMFKGGPIWRPPTLNPFTQGMPDELVPEEEREIRKGSLSNAQRERYERMLRKINPERHKVAEVMIFSIEHAEASDEICLCIKESLSNPKTELTKKLARLYVISDVLHNCTTKGMNAVSYRKAFKVHLPSIFQEIHYAYQTACSEGVGSMAEAFKQRVLACFRAWDEWGLYPSEFLIRLQNIFLGLLTANSREEEAKIFEGMEDIEDDEELMKKRRKSPPRAQLPPKSALNLVRALQSSGGGADDLDEDLDGVPIEDDIDGVPMTESSPLRDYRSENSSASSRDASKGLRGDASRGNGAAPKGGFIPSKWETVDPEEVKAGAVTTTSKWDLFEDTGSNHGVGKDESENQTEGVGGSGLVAAAYEDNEEEEEDIDGRPMDEDEDEEEEQRRQYDMSSSFGGARGGMYLSHEEELERRAKLRELELKVLAFQDELESGRRSTKHGMTISEMVAAYREKLQRRCERERLVDDDDEETNEWDESSRHRKRRESVRSGGGSRRRERSRSSSPQSVRSSGKNRKGRRSRSDSRSPGRHLQTTSYRSRSRSEERSGGNTRRRSRSRSRSRSPSSRSSRHSKHSKHSSRR